MIIIKWALIILVCLAGSLMLGIITGMIIRWGSGYPEIKDLE